jgi:hypothetical protein
MRGIIAALFLAAALADDASLRKKISDTFFVPYPPLALNGQEYGQFEAEPAVVADGVTYATGFGMLVPAVIYHPKDTGVRRPALIVVNGHGGDKYAWYSFYAIPVISCKT